MNSKYIASYCRVLTVALLLPLVACGTPDKVAIELSRPAPVEAGFAREGASSQERFGGSPAAHQAESKAEANRYNFELPAGWEELDSRQFRDVNLRPGGEAALECYLTVLKGDGGGLTANVNRWRAQLELAPVSDEQAQNLPTATLFGREAIRVELTGEGEDARSLMGLIMTDATSLATVKMTGPAALVAQQESGFEAFCASLSLSSQASQHKSVKPVAKSQPSSNQSLQFELPEGWNDVGASSMRIVNLTTPGASQCYVIRLAGEAGGLLNNLNRWRSELGMEPIQTEQLEALEEVELMGESCRLLEASGEYSGMGSLSGPGKTVLGVALIGQQSSLFVKMVGDIEDVADEKENFIAFLSSLRGS